MNPDACFSGRMVSFTSYLLTIVDNYALTFASWNKVAALYQEKFMDVALYNDTYDAFCDAIPEGSRDILELGCGPGNITRYLAAQRPDFKILATDIAPNMLKLAQENNPTVSFRVMDTREAGQLNSHFDAIMCGFCMPYLSKDDCRKLICDCAALLKPGGVVYFSTMEDDYSKSGIKTGSDGVTKMYMYFHEEAYLTQFLNENQFELLHLLKKDSQNTDGSFARDMIFIAKKRGHNI